MLKVHILDRCEFCHGKAFLFVGEYADEDGNRYPRYLPCHVCESRGERQQMQIARMGERWQDSDLIFPSKVGMPMNPSNLGKFFSELLEMASVKKIRFYDLRHTAASLMLNHSLAVIVVSRILGHSKPSITLDIYSHIYNEMQGEALRIMDELVTPIRVDLKESIDSPLR